jgi:hypothetical protein
VIPIVQERMAGKGHVTQAIKGMLEVSSSSSRSTTTTSSSSSRRRSSSSSSSSSMDWVCIGIGKGHVTQAIEGMLDVSSFIVYGLIRPNSPILPQNRPQIV